MALRSVGVIVQEPVALFEFGVAVEVFGLDRSDAGIAPLDFRVCAEVPGRPLSTKNMNAFGLVPPFGLEAAVDSDLVVVAPTAPRASADYSPVVLDAVRSAYDRGATILALCSGSFVLGAAGLLDGRRCTTHWMYFDAMERQFPTTQVDRQALFVDDGQVVTSAGTAASIDASLHLVRRELGSRVATTIARRMVVPPQRDGGQRQFVETPMPVRSADTLGPLLEYVVGHLDEDHTAESMARRATMSVRTFVRRFSAETGTTPHRWLTQQRVLVARALLEDSELGVERVAAEVGFGSAVVLRDHVRQATGLSPTDYRRRFGTVLSPVAVVDLPA